MLTTASASQTHEQIAQLLDDFHTFGVTFDTTHPLAPLLHDTAQLAASTYRNWWLDNAAYLISQRCLHMAEIAADSVAVAIASASDDTGYIVTLRAAGETIDASCSCPVAERHRTIWCKHRIAAALVLRQMLYPDDVCSPQADWFADGRPAENIPVSWTFVTLSGTVRHIRRPASSSRGAAPRLLQALCGLDADLIEAHADLPLCGRCLRSHTP